MLSRDAVGVASAKGGGANTWRAFLTTKTTFEAPKALQKIEKYYFFIEKINI